MHLEYPDYAVRPRPNRWLVIDDFGSEHNWIYRSGYTEGDRGRSIFLDSANQDPDFLRLEETTPTRHYMREAMSFSTTFGLSVELDLCIDFWHCPAWDDVRGEPLTSREHGAQIKIECITVGGHYGERLESCVTSMPELLELCWQYLELERARDLAEAAARATARAMGAAQ
ncbi:hypothetical protein CNE_1c11740 [Cupriavidus necator N-1]|uniref:Uncharacterized protein n=1 Tax=Cupriavidus necator (strain ATCC 43291 / DSM 13513 / CCUG 52238 / LMG 8453 / N-1) TaxID=1042878 RepID=G0ER11_CUPNN|nr:hypothetical protein [Cupriavidus necator]AEI76529.1 hypothetical protein CNE_1c11740 [Cupriavidus necator N-1]MDX6011349.1 hypothetical protein [Cupriavidus necator]